MDTGSDTDGVAERVTSDVAVGADRVAEFREREFENDRVPSFVGEADSLGDTDFDREGTSKDIDGVLDNDCIDESLNVGDTTVLDASLVELPFEKDWELLTLAECDNDFSRV